MNDPRPTIAEAGAGIARMACAAPSREPIPPQTNPHIPLQRGQVYSTGQEDRTPYAWPMTELPREFDNPTRRLTERELRERLSLIRLLFNDMGTMAWRHYKEGTIYKVTGFGVSSRDGQFEVEYQVDGHNGHGITFHLPIHEWFTTVILDERQPDNPNLTNPDAVFMVHRYVPVFEARRFETRAQIEERDA